MLFSRKIPGIWAAVCVSIIAPNVGQAADYQRYQKGECANNAVCNIDFPDVAAGKTLKLSNLSCYLRLFSNTEIEAAELLLINNSNGNTVLAVTPSLEFQSSPRVGQNSIQGVFVSNDTIRAVGKEGQHFRAYAKVRNSSTGNVATVAKYNCLISGSLD